MPHNILLLDDSEVNLNVLSWILKECGYNVQCYTSGYDALEALNGTPVDLILADIQMPRMNGFEFCKRVKETEALEHIPIIFISSMDKKEEVMHGFEAGGVDYITKPFSAEEIKIRVKTQLTIVDFQHSLQVKVDEQIKQLQNIRMETIFSLAKLAQSRDDDTGLHLERVQGYCKLLAKTLKEDSEYQNQIDDAFVDNIYHASPLHDIGKVGIPDSILLKPDRLTEKEFEVMKTHTSIGADTLRDVDRKFGENAFIGMGILIAESHHEKYDGTGYPARLKGQDIPLPARIMAIADVYDALRAKRAYKDGFDHNKSYDIICNGSGEYFDPVIVEAFKKVANQFDEIFTSEVVWE